MTLTELAHEIAMLPIEDIEDVVNLTFDEVEELRSAAEVQAYFEALLACGVDVRPLCKKKHPA